MDSKVQSGRGHDIVLTVDHPLLAQPGFFESYIGHGEPLEDSVWVRLESDGIYTR